MRIPERLLCPAAPGPFGSGRKDVSVMRPNGTSFIATLHYPATANGVNQPFEPSGAPYPIVSFGPGFLQSVTQYQSTLAHLASHGYFAIASQSNGGFAPSHAGFALDLRSCVDWLISQNASGEQFADAVATTRIAFSGHSMGGGSALLAAKDDLRDVAVVTLAAADTNPSSISACTSIATPTRLIVGSQDTIVPPASSATPMYANLPGPRQLCSITGGFHCGFTDADFLFCDSGGITRTAQLETTRGLMTRFLDQHLKFDAVSLTADWTETWGPSAPGVSGVVLSSDCGASLAPTVGPVTGPDGGTAQAELVITHLDSAAQAYEFLATSATFNPPTSPLLSQGGQASSMATIAIPVGTPSGTQVLLSARRLTDSATRAFALVTLEVTASSPADLDGDGAVNAADLAIMLGAWGTPGPGDLDGSGAVDAADLALLLGQWS
jgi:predicted dienelactone hydrolase